MERPYLGFVLTAFVSIFVLGALFFVSAAPRTFDAAPARPQPANPAGEPQPLGPSAPHLAASHLSAGRPQGEWRLLEPVTYENIAIFPVVGGSLDTRAFLTLDEGLSSGEVVVSEQGAAGLARSRDRRPIIVPDYNNSASVNQLVLVNHSKRPLLLLAGELVSGGKQDRIIAKDRLVAPGAEPLPLDVFCVEHGRWSSGSQFTETKIIVHPSVREQAAVKQNQTDVWQAVTSGSTAMAAPNAPPARLPRSEIAGVVGGEAPTQSYAKIYESRRVGGSVDDFVDQLQRRFARATSGLKGERVVGVVVAYGGEVAWSDIFASSELFEHYWSKLLRSYAVEALARPAVRETASSDDAREFLQPLNGREVQETEAGVYRWREISEGRLALIELEALQPKPITLHRLLLHRTS
jgi:ARG and Rhodanese-Phosphatase-superfamily-associated Protein domain